MGAVFPCRAAILCTGTFLRGVIHVGEISYSSGPDGLHAADRLSASLERLYEYFCYELSRVKAGRNQTELARVKSMVSELRESFRQADKTAGRETGGGGA